MINTLNAIPEGEAYRVWTIDNWDSIPVEYRGQQILLLSPEEFEAAPTGSTFLSVLGDLVIKGITEADQDTRAGHLAYGPMIKRDE